MELRKLGYAVILNQLVDEYQSTEDDVDRLTVAFKIIGFEVKLYCRCNNKVSEFAS